MSENNLQKPSLIKDETFDIKKIFFKFFSYWKYYLLSVILFILLGLIYIRYSDPIYKISAKILIQEPEGSKGTSGGFMPSSQVLDFGDLFNTQNNIYNELYILQTRDILSEVVDQMDLTKVYRTEGSIRNIDQYKKVPFKAYFDPNSDTIPEINIHLQFPEASITSHFKMTINDKEYNVNFNDTISIPQGKLVFTYTGQKLPSKPYVLTIKSKEMVLAEIKKNLSVIYDDKETSILVLNYNSNVPKKGEDFLKTLIQVYLTRNVNDKNEMNDSTISFIDDRIAIVSEELTAIEKEIQGFKQANKLVNLEEQAKAIIVSGGDYYQRLKEADVQLGVINTMLDFIQSDKNSNRPVPSLLTSDPSFVLLIQQYNSLLTQKSKLLVSVKESNPLVQNVTAQMSTLKSDIERNLLNQKRNIEIARSQLITENERINQMVYQAPVQERQYIDYSREKDVKQALYLYLLQKKEETSISKAASVSNATVIETPKSDFLPFFPDRMVIFGAALMMGLVLPTLIILLADLFNNRIQSREDITSQTKVTILGQIGHSEVPGLISLDREGRSSITEQFRVLRTNIDFISATKPCPIILTTSSSTGEGKSFMSGNLAQLFAFSGKKVLLIEMDLRKPTLSKLLGMPNEKGFSTYASTRNASIFDYIVPVKSFNNLHILQSGPVPPNPAELILSQFSVSLINELKEKFEIIIIDSPPYGIVTDTQLLTKYADVNLFVVRMGVSYKSSTALLNEMHTRHPSNLYVVLNDVKRGSRYEYGYGTYDGYGYGYYTDVKKKSLFKKKS